MTKKETTKSARETRAKGQDKVARLRKKDARQTEDKIHTTWAKVIDNRHSSSTHRKN